MSLVLLIHLLLLIPAAKCAGLDSGGGECDASSDLFSADANGILSSAYTIFAPSIGVD